MNHAEGRGDVKQVKSEARNCLCHFIVRTAINDKAMYYTKDYLNKLDLDQTVPALTKLSL
jgi:hypothetical protein